MRSPRWDPERYLLFGDFRTRPAAELLGRIPASHPRVVVDMGCGPGNSTRLLADRWPEAEVVGVDNSPEMLERARADHRDLRFEDGDVTVWAPTGPVDVFFSNAALQWIPDHITLLPRMLAFVAPGGSLAIQVPNNFDRPAHSEGHRIVRELFPDLDGLLPDRPVFQPTEYYSALAPEGVRVDVWETIYHQPLEGEDPVVAWTSGTFLRPLLEALEDEPERKAAFLDLYADAMRRAYPVRDDGITLLPYRRLFAVATRLA